MYTVDLKTCTKCSIEFDGLNFSMGFCSYHLPKRIVSLQLVFKQNWAGFFSGAVDESAFFDACFNSSQNKWIANTEGWVLDRYKGWNIHIQYLIIDGIALIKENWNKPYLVNYPSEYYPGYLRQIRADGYRAYRKVPNDRPFLETHAAMLSTPTPAPVSSSSSSSSSSSCSSSTSSSSIFLTMASKGTESTEDRLNFLKREYERLKCELSAIEEEYNRIVAEEQNKLKAQREALDSRSSMLLAFTGAGSSGLSSSSSSSGTKPAI